MHRSIAEHEQTPAKWSCLSSLRATVFHWAGGNWNLRPPTLTAGHPESCLKMLLKVQHFPVCPKGDVCTCPSQLGSLCNPERETGTSRTQVILFSTNVYVHQAIAPSAVLYLPADCDLVRYAADIQREMRKACLSHFHNSLF